MLLTNGNLILQLTLTIWISLLHFFKEKPWKAFSNAVLGWSSILAFRQSYLLCISLLRVTLATYKPKGKNSLSTLTSKLSKIQRSKGCPYLRFPWYRRENGSLALFKEMWNSDSKWLMLLFYFHHLLDLWLWVNKVSSWNLFLYWWNGEKDHLLWKRYRKNEVMCLMSELSFIFFIPALHSPANNETFQVLASFAIYHWGRKISFPLRTEEWDAY